MTYFKILWRHLTASRKRHLVIVLLLMLLTSLFEMVSVGAILPFIGAIINPEQLFEFRYMQPFITQLGLTTPNQLILPVTVIFISATLKTIELEFLPSFKRRVVYRISKLKRKLNIQT